jgi:hypothetical protein
MITYLELLQLIKDGKQPKEVMYDNVCYQWFCDKFNCGSYINKSKIKDVPLIVSMDLNDDDFLSSAIMGLFDSDLVEDDVIEVIDDGIPTNTE